MKQIQWNVNIYEIWVVSIWVSIISCSVRTHENVS